MCSVVCAPSLAPPTKVSKEENKQPNKSENKVQPRRKVRQTDAIVTMVFMKWSTQAVPTFAGGMCMRTMPWHNASTRAPVLFSGVLGWVLAHSLTPRKKQARKQSNNGTHQKTRSCSKPAACPRAQQIYEVRKGAREIIIVEVLRSNAPE